MNKKFFDIFVFIFFFAIWFLLFRFTGSYTKGYNIYEDYSIILIDKDLKDNGIPDVFHTYLTNNFNYRSRFCPTGDFHRILSVAVFKNNFVLYTFYVSLLGIFSSFLLYKFCRTIKISVPSSLLSGLSLISGSYVIIWSEICDYESIALLLLSLSLYFGAKAVYSEKNNSAFKLLAFLSIAASSFSKENFILLIPAFMLAFILTHSREKSKSVFRSVSENSGFMLSLLFFLIIYLSFIFFVIGIDRQNYAGVNLDVINVNYITLFLKTVFSYPITYLILLGVVIIGVTFIFNKNIQKKNTTFGRNVFYFSTAFIISFIIIIPQYVVNFKTGIHGRYLMPLMLGFYVTLIFIYEFVNNTVSVSRFLKYFYTVMLILFLVYNLYFESIPKLEKFSEECKNSTAALNYISANTDNEILVALDPVQNYHLYYSARIYIDNYEKNEIFKHQFIFRDYLHAFVKDTGIYNSYLREAYKNYNKTMIDPADKGNKFRTIFLWNYLNDKFILKNKSWFKTDDYEKRKFGLYLIYARKEL